MDASLAGKVVALTTQIQTIQQVLEIIDAGGVITAMTLQAPPRPEPEAPLSTPELPESEPPTEEPEEPEPAEPRPEEPAEPEEARDVDAPVLTVSTEGLVYPPQMMQTIRQQEVQLWQSAYDALAELGITNVPKPPSDGQAAPDAQITERMAGPPPPPTPPTVTGRVGSPPPRSPGRRR